MVSKALVASVFLTLFANAITLLMPFPFLPFMVKDFGITHDDEIGFYAGVIASALFLGRLLGGYYWGIQADVRGRRAVMLLSLGGAIITSLLFGFSSNLTMAVISRFLTGLLNGVPGTTKTIIGEVCDESSRSSAMTMLTTAWGFGMVIGPSMGGMFAEPADKYEMFDVAFFRTFPYALPSLVTAGVTFIALVLVYMYLPETLGWQDGMPPEEVQRRERERMLKGRRGSSALTLLEHEDGSNDYTLTDEKHALLLAPDGGLLERDGKGHGSSGSSSSSSSSTTTGATASTAAATEDIKKVSPHELESGASILNLPPALPSGAPTDTSIMGMLKEDTLRRLLILYGVFAFATIGVDELYTVLCATPVHLGGLGWSSSDIGLSLAVVGTAITICQVFMFPMLEKRLGSLGVMKLCCALSAIVTLFFPCLHWFQTARSDELAAIASMNETVEDVVLPDVMPSDELLRANFSAFDSEALNASGGLLDLDMRLMGLVFATLALFKIFTGNCFIAISLIMNNAVDTTRLGSYNGLGDTTASLLRSVGPSFAGLVFSWSISEVRDYPFNHHLIFIIIALIYCYSTWYTTTLPRSLNNPCKLT